jgi:hypothetical protein
VYIHVAYLVRVLRALHVEVGGQHLHAVLAPMGLIGGHIDGLGLIGVFHIDRVGLIGVVHIERVGLIPGGNEAALLLGELC